MINQSFSIFIRQNRHYKKANESDKSDTIKKGIEKNRINRKVTFLNNWSDDEAAPTLQIAAMKMICTPEEAHRLNGSKQEIKHNVDTQSKLIEWKPAIENE